MVDDVVVVCGVSKLRLIPAYAFWRNSFHSRKSAVICLEIRISFFGVLAVAIWCGLIIPRKCRLIGVTVAVWLKRRMSVSRAEDVVCCFNIIWSMCVVQACHLLCGRLIMSVRVLIDQPRIIFISAGVASAMYLVMDIGSSRGSGLFVCVGLLIMCITRGSMADALFMSVSKNDMKRSSMNTSALGCMSNGGGRSIGCASAYALSDGSLSIWFLSRC